MLLWQEESDVLSREEGGAAGGEAPRRRTGRTPLRGAAGNYEVSICLSLFLFYYAHGNSLRLVSLLLWQEESDLLWREEGNAPRAPRGGAGRGAASTDGLCVL